MNDPQNTRPAGRDGFEEDRVEFRHYLTAIERNRWLIAAIVAIITGIVLAASLILPKTYDATASVVLQEVTAKGEPTDAESVRRRLATIQTVSTGVQVREQAAESLNGESADSVASKIDVSVDPEANVIYVKASDEDPAKSADVANAVADELLAVQSSLEDDRLEAAQDELLAQIQELESAETPDEGTIQKLREQLSQLILEGALTGFELQIAEPAVEPDGAASPKPVRNTVLALFASLFLGILAALLRDQFSPRVSDAREISRLTGLPVLAGVPYSRGRMRRKRGVATAVEHGSYQTLAANLQLLRPPRDEAEVVLITSAVHAEGKSTVSARLGRALAEAGHRTLIVSVDMRWPTLHGHFRLSARPGLSDALELAERAGVSDHLLPATVKSVPIPSQSRDPNVALDVLTAGASQEDPGRLLSSDSALEFFNSMRNFDYRYILLDAPPLLGIADVFSVARAADSALLVARLDRLSVDNVSDMRDLLGRLEVDLLGAVVIGARVEGSAYYISGRRARIEDPVVAAPGAGGRS